MANKSFYDPNDVSSFQEDVCKKVCIMKGKCITDNKNDQWFLMCPHYHPWKLQYGSFVWDQLRYYREHPEEAEKKHQEMVERAKAWKEQKKKKSNKK